MRLNILVASIDLGEREDNHLSDVKKFCERYKVSLIREGTTHERGFREPMYFFSDGLGSYNIDAIRGSLKI